VADRQRSADRAIKQGRTVVTHPRTVATRVGHEKNVVPNLDDEGGLSELRLRSLMGAQLRLGIRHLAVVIGVLTALPLVLANTDVLSDNVMFGVPLAWLLVGAGLFPLLLGVALSYNRSITRLEALYNEVVLEQ
jgi:hypothetical protein